MAYAHCGDTARARQKLDELHALRRKQYIDPADFAYVEAALGDLDEALRSYEKAYEVRSPSMVYVAIDPRFIPELAGNARYQAIVDRMGFPK